MARDADAIKITRKWARTGDVTELPDIPPVPAQDPGLETGNREKGWGVDFSTFQGSLPKREELNQILREITGLCLEVNQHGGILEWDRRLLYLHPALVFGSDGVIYKSKQDVPLDRDPTNPDSSPYWGELVVDSVLGASFPLDFISQYNQGNSVNNKFVSPATLADWAFGRLLSGSRGGGLLARSNHTHSATGSASETVAGLIEIATEAEAKAGTDAIRAITPFTFRRAGDDRYSQKSHDHSYAPLTHSHRVTLGIQNSESVVILSSAAGTNASDSKVLGFVPDLIIASTKHSDRASQLNVVIRQVDHRNPQNIIATSTLNNGGSAGLRVNRNTNPFTYTLFARKGNFVEGIAAFAIKFSTSLS